MALALIGIAGEAYFRLIVLPNGYGLSANPKDFGYHTWQGLFVRNVGSVTAPNQEIRFSNHLDFWTITQVNSLGFLDREPVSRERAAESCHIALIGDSFIVGKEVDIADKAQVKLEELAARELPHLDVTTSAFGRGNFAQINQLAFYDEYARHLRPKVVAFVFVNNDFDDNSVHLNALALGIDPDHLPHITAGRGADGEPVLRPPYPSFKTFRTAPPFKQAQSSKLNTAAEYPSFAKWLEVNIERMLGKSEARNPEYLIWQADTLS